MEEFKLINNIEDIKVFTDPYRLMILKRLYEREIPSTVKQIADDMGETPAKVHYHVKKMLKAGILKLDHEAVINGIIAKYYEPCAKKFEISNDKIESNMVNNLLDHKKNFVTDIINQFKNEFVESITDEVDDGILVSTKLRLNKNQFDKLKEFIKEIEAEHLDDNENKDEYVFFAGLIKSIK